MFLFCALARQAQPANPQVLQRSFSGAPASRPASRACLPLLPFPPTVGVLAQICFQFLNSLPPWTLLKSSFRFISIYVVIVA